MTATDEHELAALLADEERLVFQHFNTNTAWELGSAMRAEADAARLPIAISIRRNGQCLFHAALSGSSADNDAWLLRKAAVVERYGHSSYYVGYELAGQQIGLVPNSGMTSPVAHWHVTDIEARLAEVTAAGGTLKDAPRDVGGGRLVASFTDPDGNVLGLIQDR